MTTYLDYSDWLDEAKDLEPSSSVRINHTAADCSGGSNSMLVEKTNDGTMRAKCFRCGRTGFYGVRSTLKSKKVGGDSCTASKVYSLPTACTYTISDWPPEARVWIDKAALTQAEVSKYCIGYSETMGRIILPVYSTNGKLVQYQSRKVLKHDDKPKYLTYRNSIGVFHIDTFCTEKTLVLVEDMLSCIRVARILPCIALLGVKLTQQHERVIHQHGYNNFIIFLDDDNVQVKKAQLTLKKSLDKLGKSLIIHSNGDKDPKDYTDAELRSILL